MLGLRDVFGECVGVGVPEVHWAEALEEIGSASHDAAFLASAASGVLDHASRSAPAIDFA